MLNLKEIRRLSLIYTFRKRLFLSRPSPFSSNERKKKREKSNKNKENITRRSIRLKIYEQKLTQ